MSAAIETPILRVKIDYSGHVHAVEPYASPEVWKKNGTLEKAIVFARLYRAEMLRQQNGWSNLNN